MLETSILAETPTTHSAVRPVNNGLPGISEKSATDDRYSSSDGLAPTPRMFVAFRVAGQEFCLDIDQVREIRGRAETTTLPQSPDHVIGVFNLRGAVLPVIDLSLRLGLGATKSDDRNVIIIVQNPDYSAGLLVEEVSDILTIKDFDLVATPVAAMTGIRELVSALLKTESGLLRLLNTEQILPGRDVDAAEMRA